MSIPTRQTMTHWQDLLAAVEGNQGIQQVPMATLRQLEGRQRVGKHILTAIEEKLSTLGLGHLPTELPNRHQQTVTLYRYGTPVSEIVEAVRKGLTEPVSKSAFETLHRFNSIPDPDTVVSKEDLGDAIEETAKSVLSLLSQVRNGEEPSEWAPAPPPEVEEKSITEAVEDAMTS